MTPRTLTRQDWHHIALTGAWYAGLPQAFAAALLDEAEPISLRAGQRLFARGDPPDGLYAILRGVVRVTAINASGQETLLAMLEVSQEQLGLMLALSRQTVNQSLRELETRGCIRRNRASVEVVDDGLLRRVRDGS